MNGQIAWNVDQWAMLRSVVQEEAARARVAASFLPLYGPLEPGARFVAKQMLEVGANSNPPPAEQLSVDTDPGVWDLATLAINVTVSSSQMAEPGLTSATQLFRRAANVIARLEDSVIFNGQRAKNSPPSFNNGVPEVKPKIFTVSGGGKYPSLLNPDGSGTPPNEISVPGNGAALGQNLVSATAEAVATLEANGHLGPYACVLDQKFFVAANSPSTGSMVLPSDRMTPFLGEAPLRSSTLPSKSGVVVALGGAPIDIAVAKDIDVKFLQVTTDNKFVFRVSEKLVLRVKDSSAVVVLK